jgi:predicted nucleic acid-binding protein
MPSNGRFLLDTNIIIALLEGDDAVLSNLEQAAEVFISGDSRQAELSFLATWMSLVSTAD